MLIHQSIYISIQKLGDKLVSIPVHNLQYQLISGPSQIIDLSSEKTDSCRHTGKGYPVTVGSVPVEQKHGYP